MSGTTETVIDVAIKEYMHGLVDTMDFQRTPLLDMASEIKQPSDNYIRWPVQYGANSSTAHFDEGDAASAAGNGSYSEAKIDPETAYRRTVINITGHAEDRAKNGHFDIIQNEIDSAWAEHMRTVEELAISDLESAIDDSGSYAGLTRSTVNFDSTESAASGSLALSHLRTMVKTLAADPIAMPIENAIIISPWDTLDEYLNVGFGSGASLPHSMNSEGKSFDAGKFHYDHSYSGIPWKTIPGMTSGGLLCIILALFQKCIYRKPKVEIKASEDDSKSYHITSCIKTIYKNPRWAGKITT